MSKAVLISIQSDWCKKIFSREKTAGQRKDRPKDLSWDNLERVKVTIICEAMALVFSGEYEEKESGQ